VDTNKVYSYSFKEIGYVFQKNLKSTTPSSYTLLYFIFKLPIFNFQKMTNVPKGYAYRFSDFITYQKNCNKEQST
jgi:hypothetical protein